MNGLLAAIAVLVGCAGGKSTPSGGTGGPPQGHTLGTVTLAHAAEGCAVLIALEPPGEIGHLMPVGLDERFRKEGLKLSFTYTLAHPLGRMRQGDASGARQHRGAVSAQRLRKYPFEYSFA